MQIINRFGKQEVEFSNLEKAVIGGLYALTITTTIATIGTWVYLFNEYDN